MCIPLLRRNIKSCGTSAQLHIWQFCSIVAASEWVCNNIEITLLLIELFINPTFSHAPGPYPSPT